MPIQGFLALSDFPFVIISPKKLTIDSILQRLFFEIALFSMKSQILFLSLQRFFFQMKSIYN